jgi:hypothetical protein
VVRGAVEGDGVEGNWRAVLVCADARQ